MFSYHDCRLGRHRWRARQLASSGKSAAATRVSGSFGGGSARMAAIGRVGEVRAVASPRRDEEANGGDARVARRVGLRATIAREHLRHLGRRRVPLERPDRHRADEIVLVGKPVLHELAAPRMRVRGVGVRRHRPVGRSAHARIGIARERKRDLAQAQNRRRVSTRIGDRRAKTPVALMRPAVRLIRLGRGENDVLRHGRHEKAATIHEAGIGFPRRHPCRARVVEHGAHLLGGSDAHVGIRHRASRRQ